MGRKFFFEIGALLFLKKNKDRSATLDHIQNAFLTFRKHPHSITFKTH